MTSWSSFYIFYDFFNEFLFWNFFSVYFVNKSARFKILFAMVFVRQECVKWFENVTSSCHRKSHIYRVIYMIFIMHVEHLIDLNLSRYVIPGILRPMPNDKWHYCDAIFFLKMFSIFGLKKCMMKLGHRLCTCTRYLKPSLQVLTLTILNPSKILYMLL